MAQSCLTLCDPMDCSTSGFPVHLQLLEFTQTHVHWVSDAIQPSHPLSSPSPPTFNLSSIRVFSNESVLHIRWPKYWSFSFSISPSNEYPGPVSFRMDCWISLQSKGLSRVFNTTVQKNQQSYSLFCPFSLDSGLCFISLWLRGFFSMTYVPLLLLSVLADSLVCHTYTAFWNDPTQNIFFIIPNTLWVCYYKNQFSSVAQSCLTLCNPMNHSTPGLPVHHQLPDSTQTHVHLLGATLGITDKMEAQSPAPSPHSAGTDPGMKELGLIILTCLFLSSAELTEKEY